MEQGIFRNIIFKISINITYRRVLILLLILFIMLIISYGFLIYQVRIINLNKINKYTTYQERELYISKFYNSFNKNELIKELFAVTNDPKYLEMRKENLMNMEIEFDSLYWYCRESEDYCIRLDSSRFFFNMYLNRFIPESDHALDILNSERSDTLEVSVIKSVNGEVQIGTIRLNTDDKDKVHDFLTSNLNIIEKKIMQPTQWIVRSDRNKTRLNQKLVNTRIKSHRLWKRVVIVLALGLIFILFAVFIFILLRPIEKPLPLYNMLPDRQYSAVYEGFESELLELLQTNIDLFRKYEQLILVFPRGSFFPIQIISAFQSFSKETGLDLQIIDSLKVENLAAKRIYIVLEEETIARIVEAIAEKNLVIGKEIGILAYGDSPLKRIVANGITVINILYEDCDETGYGQAKSLKKICLRFINRGSL